MTATRAAGARNANRVRIVGGLWRSRILKFADRPGLRPTPDRVRETVFNWLGQDLSGRSALDLYAGSGALGFEAASRGAKRVVMVERDPVNVSTLQASCAALEAQQVEVVRSDALEFLECRGDQYDVIFLDPPFADAPWPLLFGILPSRLAPDGIVYCESGGPIDPPPGWAVHRQSRAGQVTYALLIRTPHEPSRGLPGNV